MGPINKARAHIMNLLLTDFYIIAIRPEDNEYDRTYHGFLDNIYLPPNFRMRKLHRPLQDFAEAVPDERSLQQLLRTVFEHPDAYVDDTV